MPLVPVTITGEFTREEWRGLVVGDDFRVVRVGMIESKSADW